MQLKVIGKIEAQLKFVNFKLKTLNDTPFGLKNK
jgi:hypothetical protein